MDAQRTGVKTPRKQAVPLRRLSFNEWIDKIHSHVKAVNNERYGINTSSTNKD